MNSVAELRVRHTVINYQDVEFDFGLWTTPNTDFSYSAVSTQSVSYSFPVQEVQRMFLFLFGVTWFFAFWGFA